MRYSKGVSWVSDTRIPFVDEGDRGNATPQGRVIRKNFKPGEGIKGVETNRPDNSLGRFTPNLLVCDDMLNDGIKPNKGHRAKSKVSGYGEFGGGKNEYHGIGEYMEVDSKSRYYDLDLWFDKMLEKL